MYKCRGVACRARGGGGGGGGVREAGRTMASPTSISKPNKIQEFQFQTSGILLFIGV